MDLTSYSRRLGASSISEAFINDTIEMVNYRFEDSNSYEKIIVNNEEKDCLYKFHKTQSNIVYVTLRPLEVLSKGLYIEFRNKNYIIKDFVPNDIYPKAEIILCNNTLRWKDTFGALYEYPIVLTGNSLALDSATNTNKYVLRSDGSLTVMMAYDDISKTIAPTQRFVINGKVYETTGIDDTEIFENKGILILTLTSTAKSNSDDVENNVADNSENSEWGEW